MPQNLPFTLVDRYFRERPEIDIELHLWRQHFGMDCQPLPIREMWGGVRFSNKKTTPPRRQYKNQIKAGFDSCKMGGCLFNLGYGQR